MVSFPRTTQRSFQLALGAGHFLEFVGELQEWSTIRSYGPRVRDWMQYNFLGGYDWREVTDAKVCAFAGWLSDPAGRGSTDKCLNGWTSAINDFFDKSFGVRPFNTHTVARLKKKYHQKQLERTLHRLQLGNSRKPEPKEARLALPALGFRSIARQGLVRKGVWLSRAGSLFVLAAFVLRPNTVQGFFAGDVRLQPQTRTIWILVRQCKRWPELRAMPAAREIDVGARGSVLDRVFELLLAAERADPLWYLQLARHATPESAATVAARWVRELCPAADVPCPPGRKYTAYSLRIAVVSTMWAYSMDERWIQSWGYWRTKDQYLTYVRKNFGRHPLIAGLVSFGFALQGGRPFDFVAAPRSGTYGAVGLSSDGNQLRAAPPERSMLQ